MRWLVIVALLATAARAEPLPQVTLGGSLGGADDDVPAHLLVTGELGYRIGPNLMLLGDLAYGSATDREFGGDGRTRAASTGMLYLRCDRGACLGASGAVGYAWHLVVADVLSGDVIEEEHLHHSSVFADARAVGRLLLDPVALELTLGARQSTTLGLVWSLGVHVAL